MRGYSTASIADAAYIIGGDYTRDVIAEFKNDIWRNVGSLVKPRDSQGSISINGETMIIGGIGGRYIITHHFSLGSKYKFQNIGNRNLEFHDREPQGY